MALLDQLKDDMKAAMKAREKGRLTTIRGLISELKNMAINGKEVSGQDEIVFLSKQAKQRRESIETYKDAGRQDLVDKEQAELDVIREYLPEQLSDEKAEEVVQGIIDDVGAESPADLGKVMGQAMQKLKGKYPGAQVKDIALKLLS